jgi:1-acyl-sn-glycerol-3-phosphate acyltransferase
MAEKYPYPRRRIIRAILHTLSIPAFRLLARLEIKGEENLPQKGPFLVVANHFSFVDPAALVRIAKWPIEFLGAADPPNAPEMAKFLPKLWGIHKLYRGTGSREALRAGEAVLRQNGILGLFPEGGSWAQVLRPARPGTSFLTTRTGAPILPIGLWGMTDVFPIRFRNQARVQINIGKPFGPFTVTGRGRERREQLDEIGHEIMRRIAELIPEEVRGFYSSDPGVREAARGTEIYPWADKVEGEVEGEVR